jgi:hypothetical protein
MQRDAGVPSVVVSIIEAIVILGLIVAWPLEMGASTRKGSNAPTAGAADVGSVNP